VGCREIGLLLLCFTPCLYCDVTDSWRLSSRWKRIAISAAGVYFELLLATAAGILWLLLPVGFARTLASSIMVTCTISTLMINFNPFFRYDGYYILSDLWGVPNLMQQAGRALWAYTAWVLGGAKPVVGNFQVAPGPLALFALLGGLYRLVFLVSLLWMLWFLLVPIGLAPLAVVIIASSVSLSALSAWKLGEKLFQQMHGSMPLKMGRIAFVGTVLTAGLGILLCYPFRISFQTRGWSSYTDTQPLYASQEASIDRVLQEEGSIAAESEIAALSAFEETRELQAAEQQVAEMETKIEMLRIATVDDSQASYAAPLAEAVLTEYRQRLAILRDEAAGRHLRSPRSGWLIPTSDRPAIGLASPQLRAVGDSLLNLKNQGAFIPRGAILGWVASSRKLTFQTLVPEKDLGQIAIGDVAYARLDASPFQSLPAKVIRITTAPIEKMPSSLTKDPFVAATYDAQGNLLMEMPHYLVTLQTEREWSEATPGNRCFVRFQTAPESFFSRAIRMISRWTVFR
jgi:putative peptide zinc metalloprotease protein